MSPREACSSWLLSLVVAGLVAGLGACGGGSTAAPDGGNVQPADDADAAAETGVPAVRLESDPATACPGAYATTAPTAGRNDGFEVAGQSRNFWILEPASGAGPYPTLIAFNGTGGNGGSFLSFAGLQDFADAGWLVISPSSAGNGTVWPVWDSMRQPGDDRPNVDLAYFDTLVACVAGHYAIDANRIYIGGHSAGGIFANTVLQRRSQLLAGGIVASGVFSLTSPPDGAEMDETFALVTWGGDDDTYSGGANGVNVPKFNFVEQASLASQYYAAQPNVGQAHCVADVGHRWLPINEWFIEVLLAHPKGVPGTGSATLPPVAGATCSTEPFVREAGEQVVCIESPGVPDCESACQLMADCAVENGTVGPVLEPQLRALGFSGEGNRDCTGCVASCQQTATTTADLEVLTCFAEAEAAATCGPGIGGATPLIDGINACCKDRDDSPLCLNLCQILATNSSAIGFFPTCQALVAQ